MSTDNEPSSRALTPSLADRVDAACDRFEAAWRAGQGARIEDHLNAVPGPGRGGLLRELLALELELRRGQGERPDAEDYRPRFPEHGPLIDAVFGAAASTVVSSLPGAAHPLSRASAPSIEGFEILGELGRGGMGVVYKARRLRLNRTCAVKMILAGVHATAESSARFLAEAETVARLRHPNIVQIYGIGDHDGRPYVELEYVEGGSLADRLDGTPWPPHRAARLLETLSRAMDAAHGLGVVHRDLKPANVLLTADGTPKVTDFGLAKTMDAGSSLTQSGAVLGTPSYMAPEQAEGKAREVGPAADVYALGAVLYELITGRAPFRAATVLLTLEQVKSSEPVPPSRLQPGLPRDVETVTLKCLQKNPAARYASAAALAEDLRRFQAGVPVLARRVGAVERGWRWCRRNPVVAGLAASVLGLILAGAAGAAVALVRLDDAAGRQRDLASAATEARNRAFEQADESRNRLVQLNLSNAMRLIDEGDLSGGLPWLLEAMRRDRGDERAQAIHRERLAVVLGHCPRLARFWSHPSRPWLAASTPDGRRLAVAGEDGLVRVWDADAGEPLGSWRLDGRATVLAFDPGGRKVVTAASKNDDGSGPSVVGVRDATTGRAVGGSLAHAWHVYHAAFSPDGRRLAVAAGQDDRDPVRCKGEVQVWDAVEGRPVGAPIPTGGPAFFAAFSPDGRRVATASLGLVRVWDAETRRPLIEPIRHAAFAEYVEFSAEGRRLLTSCHAQWARVWDADTGEPVTPLLSHGGGMPVARFSPDGRRVVTASEDNSARVWDAETGQPLTPLLAHDGPVGRVAFSPDGRRVVTACSDQTARVWDAETGRPASPPLRHTGPVLEARFDGVGRFLMTVCSDGTVRSWDLASGPRVSPMAHAGPIIDAAFSPDGRRVVTASRDGTARVWDAGTGQPVTQPLRHAGRWTVHAAFSPDGRRVVSSGLDRTARVWDAETGKPALPPLDHPDRVGYAVFSPDGRRVLTVCGDQSARLWDAATGRAVGAPVRHKGEVFQVEFSPDGRRALTAGADGLVKVIEADGGRETGPTLRHERGVFHATFSPDGRQVATAGEDQTARIWDAQTGRQVGPPMVHQGEVHVAAYRRDGLRLLTGGSDGTARVWDPRTGRQVAPPMRPQGTVTSVSFSTDGRLVVTGSTNGTARVWDAETGQPLTPVLRQQGVISAAALDPQGRHVLTAGQDGAAMIWAIDVGPLRDPLLDTTALARLVSGREFNAGGDLVLLSPEAVRGLWKALRTRYPPAFVTPPDEVAAWHWREAQDCQRRRLLPAALVHLNAAHAVRPGLPHVQAARARLLAELGKGARNSAPVR